MTTEEKMAIAEAARKMHFEPYLQFGLADLQLGRKMKLTFSPDNHSFTDQKLINIGVETWPADTKDELLLSLDFSLGHEMQHIRSTPNKIWRWGHQRAYEVFLMETAKIVTPKKKWLFRNDNDFKIFEKWLFENGYPLNFRLLHQMSVYVLNCVEDGRIERIRSVKRKGFKEKVILFRGKEWKAEELPAEPFENLDDADKIGILLNQVLSLSTTSLYQKGFRFYQGTELWDECQELIPCIKAAVSSFDCKGCMENGIEIIKLLTPRILKACKLPDFEEFMQKLLEMVSKMMEADYGEDEFDQESGSTGGLFGPSDMDSEEKSDEKNSSSEGKSKASDPETEKSSESDKDMESKDGSEKGTEANAKESQDAKGSGQGSDGQDHGEVSDSQSNGTSCAKESAEAADKKGSGEISERENSGKELNKAGSQMAEYAMSFGESSETEDTGSDNDSGQATVQKNESELSTANGKRKGNSKLSGIAEGEFTDDMQKQIEEAMEKAAISQEADTRLIKESLDEVASKPVQPKNQFPHQRKQENSGTDIAGNPKAENVVKLYPNTEFKEMKRKYELKDALPFDLKGKSDRFSAKIDEVLKNQYKPAIRCRKSGKVDGMMLHKLAMNKTDIFIKPAIVNEFSGCCYMLVDNSGSMGYGEESKREYAWLAVSEIEAGYSKLMPLKIVAFDTQRAVVHEVVKDWNEKPQRSCAYNFMLHGRDGGGNMDGFSISVAADEILRQNGRKKLLLVLSDGAPDSYERTKQAVDWARKQGIIVAGIYFSEVDDEPSDYEIERFEGMYGDKGYAICCSPNQISEKLYNLMKREFIN